MPWDAGSADAVKKLYDRLVIGSDCIVERRLIAIAIRPPVDVGAMMNQQLGSEPISLRIAARVCATALSDRVKCRHVSVDVLVDIGPC